MNDKFTSSNHWKHILWLLIPLLFGVAVVLIAPRMKKDPQQTEPMERSIKVRTIKISKMDVVPRVTGYGTVASARTWEAVAEVAGQVIWISDNLRDGRVVNAGTELLRIEDSNYRLVLAQAKAQLNASAVKARTMRDGLAIAQQDLILLRAELERNKALANTGTVSKATLEVAERSMLAGQIQVTNLQNSIDLNFAERQVLIAQHDVAKLDLQRTSKIAPFDVRITRVDIGIAQYANKGQLMFSADGLDVAEIVAQFPIGILRPLMGTRGELQVRQGALALQAIVRLRTATHTVEWPARVSRVSGTIDPQTQSLGVVVAVDRPSAMAKPGERPPLFRNTFVEIELSSPPLKNQIVVPRNAVHGGMVYVVDTDSRLEKRKVQISFSQRGYVVLKKGLNAGERIVTSDLVTAVNGMLLTPQEDPQTQRRVFMEATGQES